MHHRRRFITWLRGQQVRKPALDFRVVTLDGWDYGAMLMLCRLGSGDIGDRLTAANADRHLTARCPTRAIQRLPADACASSTRHHVTDSGALTALLRIQDRGGKTGRRQGGRLFCSSQVRSSPFLSSSRIGSSAATIVVRLGKKDLP